MIFIYYISIVIALLIFKLWWDYRAKNKKKRIINHLRSGLIDVSVYAISSFTLFFWISDRNHLFVIGMVLFAVSFRWIFFDLIFAKLNWNTFDYHGNSSKVDVFLKKLGKYHFLVKLIPIIIGVILILL